MKILITGGAGFIGSNIAEYHLNKGDDVYAVDNLSTGTKENVSSFSHQKNFRFEEADILTWVDLSKAVAWADRIYHMAAVVGMFEVLENKISVLETNILTYQRLLTEVLKVDSNPSILIPSSSSVYGANKKQPHQEDDLLMIKSKDHSRWSYAISKLTVESFSQAYVRDKNLKITIVRLFNNIGPRQTGFYGMVVPRLIEQAINGNPMTIFGTGEQTRSFCDVRDSVAMCDRLVSNEKSINQITNMGSIEEISITNLALLIKKLTNSDSPLEYMSYEEAYGEDMDETFRRRPCLKKLKSFIDYDNKWSLEQTLLDLIDRHKH